MTSTSRTRLCDLDPNLGSLDSACQQSVLSLLEDRDKVIRLQQQQIERLGAELARVKAEKDLLLTRLVLASGDDAAKDTNTSSAEDSGVDKANGDNRGRNHVRLSGCPHICFGVLVFIELCANLASADVLAGVLCMFTCVRYVSSDVFSHQCATTMSGTPDNIKNLFVQPGHLRLQNSLASFPSVVKSYFIFQYCNRAVTVYSVIVIFRNNPVTSIKTHVNSVGRCAWTAENDYVAIISILLCNVTDKSILSVQIRHSVNYMEFGAIQETVLSQALMLLSPTSRQ
ncbi:hypothetical protein RRG08_021023 [Elysia crispata]|uniref:Uncharacterized protein n=1 Tax=Elysia crispata TaxID=231223 RepID=A0AAE0ZRZ2_9GAST|nr:hypothetical protein RRG08_021023 [Elysia crispata]